MSPVDKFFSYSRERHSIHLRRLAGQPWPWTDDEVLRTYRFTQVFRELDRTTAWFKNNCREELRSRPACLLATVVFRWFCRIEIGEVLFGQGTLGGGTPFERFLADGDGGHLRTAIRSAFPRGPYVTGAYMIRSPNDMDKLDGMVHLCELFHRDSDWRSVAGYMLRNPGAVSLQSATEWLKSHTGQGPFLAYEVITDLRHTDLLHKAPDIMTWANIGPGCLRGINRLIGRRREVFRRPKHEFSGTMTEAEALAFMSNLLEESRDPARWPPDWPTWEMRDVEHTLCEVSKWLSAGEGNSQKRKYQRRES